MKNIKSTRGNGKHLFFDYYYYIKFKRASYKHLKEVYKRISFDDYMALIDYIIENYY